MAQRDPTDEFFRPPPEQHYHAILAPAAARQFN